MMGDVDASVGIMQVSSTHPGLPHSDPFINMFLVQQINLCLDAQKSVMTLVCDFQPWMHVRIAWKATKNHFLALLQVNQIKVFGIRAQHFYFVSAPMRLWCEARVENNWPRECCLNVWPGVNLHNLMQSYLFCCPVFYSNFALTQQVKDLILLQLSWFLHQFSSSLSFQILSLGFSSRPFTTITFFSLLYSELSAHNTYCTFSYELPTSSSYLFFTLNNEMF